MGSEVIAICNPATREVRFLPDVPHEGEDFICSIGFEREENKYKVVLTIETNGKLSRAWVFTLGIDKSWREMIKYGEHDYYIAGHISGICISGIIYRISLAPDYCIVAFDVKSEIFTSITMSIELCRSFIDCDNMLIEVNGKLGMMKYSDYLFGNDIYLWVFEEHEEWKHEILHIPLEREPNEFYFDPFMIRKYGAEEIVFAIHITSRSHDDVLVFYIYDMKNKSWRHFEVQEFPGQIEMNRSRLVQWPLLYHLYHHKQLRSRRGFLTESLMSPNGKEIACQSVALDVLSSLPENVIHDILKFLPLRDVVRTNILSTKWRYKWCRIPQLELHIAPWLVEDLRSSSIQFNKILYHLLTFHAGPISKFIFSLYTNGRGRPELDKLVYFLSRNGVQHLDFTFCGCSQYKMHSSFFTCSQLRYLSLSGCEIQIVPPAFKGFHKLISLKLSEVTISSIVLESLIPNCPLLEQLVCDGVAIDDPEISAPMLRSFEYIEDEGFICLKSAPYLAKLSLTHMKYHVGTGSFLESFSALEHLKLNRFSLKFVVAVAKKVPARLPFNLKCVKHLCLDSILLKRLDNVLCVLCLLRSFLHLQYFEIQVIDEDDEIPELECLNLEAFSDVTFIHLREVKLIQTIGSEPELQLIKLLLAKSPMLERMLIQPSKTGGHASRTITIPIVLNSFRRASPEVQVVYNL